MGASEYYLPTGVPSTGSDGDSATIRNEFSAIKEGISEKLPDLSGNNNQIIGINGGATGLEAKSASDVKNQLSLENVDNTSDADKPVSTAQTAAFEPILSLPAEDGMLLQSTTAGVKSFVFAGPAGEIKQFAMATVPSGFLECNGAAISRTTYSSLYAALGTLYGVGDGSTTFNIPDYRGKFLRAWDHGSGIDPDAATRTNSGNGTTGDNVGTQQADEIKSHTHTAGEYNAIMGGGAEGGWNLPGATGATGGSETRPINVNVLCCIRY